MKFGRMMFEGEPRAFIQYGTRATLLQLDDYNSLETDVSVELSEVELLPPVMPSKVVAVGLNYRDHIEEMQTETKFEPTLFLKPDTSVIGHGAKIIYPEMSERVDYEAELAVVIGKTCKDVSRVEAKDYIFGYTCLNDVTARDLQKKDGQWTRAKGFDTFCPIGPVIETELDPTHLALKSILNGEVMQESNTECMIFDVFTLISFISKIMTLKAGDVIATGTPKGISPMKKGDTIEIEIENIGKLVNVVK